MPWKLPVPVLIQPAERTVTCTGRPRRCSAAESAAYNSSRPGDPRTSTSMSPTGAIAVGAGESRCPGSVDVGGVDVVDAGERLCEDLGRPERFDEHVGQSAVVGAVGVGSHESGVADPAAGEQAC